MRAAIAIVTGAALSLGVATAQSARVGEPAPDFTLQAADGSEVSLSDYEGEVVVLEWTNDGCPFVQKHYGSGNMQRLQKRATADGTAWLTVISSAPGEQGYADAERATALTEERNAAPTHVLLDPDGEVGRAYGAKTTPHMYVIDEEGTLAYAGAIDTIVSTDQADIARADNYVADALQAVKAGRDVAVRQTQPYGCSVKYGS